LVSQDRRHLFVTPCLNFFGHSGRFGLRVGSGQKKTKDECKILRNKQGNYELPDALMPKGP
jgi:hypothetical protein